MMNPLITLAFSFEGGLPYKFATLTNGRDFSQHVFQILPTKEAVVLEDDFDPMLIQAFRQQPSDLSPIQALRMRC